MDFDKHLLAKLLEETRIKIVSLTGNDPAKLDFKSLTRYDYFKKPAWSEILETQCERPYLHNP